MKSHKYLMFKIVLTFNVVVIVALLVLLCLPKTHEVVAEITVQTIKISNDAQEFLYGDKLKFVRGEESTTKHLTPVNEVLERNSYLIYEYSFQNKEESRLTYKISFEKITNKNCFLSYSINYSAEINFNKIITGDIVANGSAKVELFIRIENLSLDASLKGELNLSMEIA